MTALATGLGALPFAFLPHVSRLMVALAGALAGGLMLGASFGLIAEATPYGRWQALAGAGLGVLFILATQRALQSHDFQFGFATGAGARAMALVVIVMTIHSCAEGVAIGVSFGGATTLAEAVTVAIAVHNIPEGLAITAVLRPRGTSVAACAAWSVFSSLPQPLMAVAALLLVETFRPVLPFGMGFAAGAMVFMVLVELLPEAYEAASRPAVALLVSTALVGMLLLQRYLS